MVNKTKSNKVDKGKGKMIKSKKPKKLALQTGRAFKIYEPRAPVPPKSLVAQPTKRSPTLKKRPVEAPPQVARILKLVDDERDIEA